MPSDDGPMIKIVSELRCCLRVQNCILRFLPFASTVQVWWGNAIAEVAKDFQGVSEPHGRKESPTFGHACHNLEDSEGIRRPASTRQLKQCNEARVTYAKCKRIWPLPSSISKLKCYFCL